MHVEGFSLPHAWYRRAGEFLTSHEAENNLLLGLGSSLMNEPGVYAEYYLSAAVEDDRVVGAAVMTPPYNLVLSHAEHPDVVAAIAHHVYQSYSTLPGVSARKEIAAEFAELWTERTGNPHELDMAQRIYELRAVTPPAPVPGSLRQAGQSDIDVLVEWREQFAVDAHMRPDLSVSRAWAERVTASTVRRVFLWEVDGRPVSMVGVTGPTPHGIRIGPVYTPAAERRKGFASACTAAVSQLMLDEGRTLCFLYTNLANPTSNKIYQEIGYAPVCDADVYVFTAPS